MPRKPRIDLAGYHHIINRGVNRTDIFLSDEDYEMFLMIVCKACRAYKAILHDYCLMSNHFHLLVETELNNLSLFMKQINANYAIYFNKKTKRSGHLWQGRFYSRYIVGDEYYYRLVRYIEQNPVEAGIVTEVGEYPYTLGSVIANRNKPVPCTRHSKLLRELSFTNIQELIGVALDDEDKTMLQEIHNQKVIIGDSENRPAHSIELKKHFPYVNIKAERNKAILSAVEDGYTQAEVGKYLKLSRSMVSKIVKSGDSTPDPI